MGRVTTEANVLGTFSYDHDGVTSRLASVTYPNSQTSAYSYLSGGQDHRLQTIHHKYPSGATLSKFDYTYDAVGNIVTWRQQADATAVLWKYGYDAADQLESAVKETTDPTPAVLKRYAYAYDPAGNRTAEQVDDAIALTSHDKLNRLTTQVAGGPIVVAGTVNEPATVTIQGAPAAVSAANAFRGTAPLTTGTNTLTIQATDPAGNSTTRQWTVDVSGPTKSFTFDANGNLTSDGSRSFEWDARDQLVAVNTGTYRTEFAYDSLQRRVRVIEKNNGVVESDTRVLWCATAICEERAANGNTVTRRAFSEGEQVTGANRYFVTDHLGSVTVVTDDSALILARYAFDPFGERFVVGGTDLTRVGFTGHQWLATGTGWLSQYRLLDSVTARWASEDPLGLGDGPNRYAYVRNNPLARVDLDGRVGVIALPIPGNPAAGAIAIAIPFLLALAKKKQCEDERQRDCFDQWHQDVAFCDARYQWRTRAHSACKDRANNRLWACLDNLPSPGPLDPARWSK